MTQRRKIVEKAKKNLLPAILKSDGDKIRDQQNEISNVLQEISISTRQPCFEKVSFVVISDDHDYYQLFGFEPVYIFNVRIFKKVRKYLFRRLKSGNFVLRGPETSVRTYRLNRTAILRACIEMFKGVQRVSHVFGQLVHYSSNDNSNALNGIFPGEGIRGKL